MAVGTAPVHPCHSPAGQCRPLTLAGVLKLKAEYPDARLVVGNTEVGIEMKFKDARYPVLIAVTHVPALNNMEVCWYSFYLCQLFKLYQMSAGSTVCLCFKVLNYARTCPSFTTEATLVSCNTTLLWTLYRASRESLF